MKRMTGFLILAALAASAYADGDAQRGQVEWSARCATCHAINADRVGPRHGGVFGRRAGSVPGFNYSPALKAAGHTWDAVTLDRWLTDPEKFVPGQRMFVKVPEARERQDIIAYLRTLKS
ncbi:MAG: c-type cytochrome [Pseudomonadota bacterium]